MTEQTLLPPPDEPHAAKVVPPKAQRRDLVPWLYGLGFLVLTVAILYLWQNPGMPGETATNASALQAIDQHLSALNERLTRLEQRPPVDLGKITSRLDALEGKGADQAQLASRLDTLSGRIESLSGRNQSGLDVNKQQLDALSGRISALESKGAGLDAIAGRLSRIARLQEASFALVSGRPLGDLPNAPEPLAKYSHLPPPTESQLRARFPAAARAALAAKDPDSADAPFMDRVWDKAQGLITIRRGGDVVIGNPTASILGHAQIDLDAGDLAGATDALQALTGPPAQAMAAWLSESKGLLNARAALAEMADHT